MKRDPTPAASAGQARAEVRVNAFQHGGGPSVAAVEATSMPMVVADFMLSGNPIVDLFGYAREEIIGHNDFMPAGPGMKQPVRIVMRLRCTQLK